VVALKKYDLQGKEVGEVSIKDDLLSTTANAQMIKDYLVALRANKRQWSASTKSRAEVNHSGQKPHPQKGTGRARQGYLGAAQYKGGGRVHAPRPKFDQHVRINRKERRQAIKHLLSEKILGECLHILKYDPLKAPKTKTVQGFLDSRKLAGKRILFLGEGIVSAKVKSAPEKYETFAKSIRNIPKLDFMLMPNAGGYDLAVCQHIVIMEPAFDELMMLLGAQK
jgi:50S ribosomal protein L4, bacterial/organelle